MCFSFLTTWEPFKQTITKYLLDKVFFCHVFSLLLEPDLLCFCVVTRLS